MSAVAAPAAAAAPATTAAVVTPIPISAAGTPQQYEAMHAAVDAAYARNGGAKGAAAKPAKAAAGGAAAGAAAGAGGGTAKAAVRIRIRPAVARDCVNVWVAHMRAIRESCRTHYSGAETAIWSAPQRRSAVSFLKRIAANIFLVAERVSADAGADAAAPAPSWAVATADVADDMKARAAQLEAAVAGDAAAHDNPICGFAEMELAPAAQPHVDGGAGGGAEASLVAVYVSPDHAGTGVGKALLTDLLARARAQRDAAVKAVAAAAAAKADGKESAPLPAAVTAAAACGHVFLHASFNGAHFYPKFGFKPTGVLAHTFTDPLHGTSAQIGAIGFVQPF